MSNLFSPSTSTAVFVSYTVRYSMAYSTSSDSLMLNMADSFLKVKSTSLSVRTLFPSSVPDRRVAFTLFFSIFGYLGRTDGFQLVHAAVIHDQVLAAVQFMRAPRRGQLRQLHTEKAIRLLITVLQVLFLQHQNRVRHVVEHLCECVSRIFRLCLRHIEFGQNTPNEV